MAFVHIEAQRNWLEVGVKLNLLRASFKVGILGCALLLGGCGHRAPDITGNEFGGVIGPRGSANPTAAFTEAQAYCQKFNRQAKITQSLPEQGSTTFECI